jgi:hypothetical protein
MQRKYAAEAAHGKIPLLKVCFTAGYGLWRTTRRRKDDGQNEKGGSSMKEKMEVWMQKLTEETTVTKRELALGAAVCTLAGMVVGILIARVTNGLSWSLSIMSNNGNDNGNDNGNNSGNYDTGCGEEPEQDHNNCKKKKCCKKRK